MRVSSQPLQLRRKFFNPLVAVDRNRRSVSTFLRKRCVIGVMAIVGDWSYVWSGYFFLDHIFPSNLECALMTFLASFESTQ